MSPIDEIRATLDEVNAVRSAKLQEAANSDGAAGIAALAEAKRMRKQADTLTEAILDWNEGRFQEVVGAVEGMVAEERRAQSDILGRLLTLADSLRRAAGLGPAPVQPVTASTIPAIAAPPVAPGPGAALPGAPAAFAAAPPADPDKRFTDLSLLHPAVREKLKAVIADLKAAEVPFKIFETFRTPERQRMLFLKGRVNGQIVDRSKVVTFADAWHSYHQYGLAVDMVIDNPPMNMWETKGVAKGWWESYHDIARKHGLEPLSFEKPHVQIEGTKASALLAGELPSGGDASWAENLSAAIARWPEDGKPPPLGGGERPSLQSADSVEAARLIDWASLPAVAESPFTSMFGGQAWRVDRRGVYTASSPNKPQRTPGSPITAGRIVELYGDAIAAAAKKYSIAPELLIMTIGTEAADFRGQDFSGPATFRWEAEFVVRNTGDKDIGGSAKGDYSAGPMQVMADTARGLNKQEELNLDADKLFEYFKSKPRSAPASVGLYDAPLSIEIGACYIRRQFTATQGNPILVAAGYNAGSLKASGTNAWGLQVTGDHLDRAAKWFGDACEVLASLGR